MHIGGPAEAMAFPETIDEFIAVVDYCQRSNYAYRVVGNGSNIIFDDAGFAGVVIKTSKMKHISFINDHQVYVEAGMSNQAFILQCHERNMGGLEYLYSVPGTVGGAIFMNAGRGKEHNLFIGQKVLSVDIWDGQTRRTLSARDCEFDNRQSVFHHHRDWIILGVLLVMKKISPEEGKELIRERMEFVNANQHRMLPNCGTVFRSGFHQTLFPQLPLRVGHIVTPNNNANWILNEGGALACQAMQLVEMIEEEHKKNNLPVPVREIEFIPTA